MSFDAIAVGIKEIDDQHVKLLDCLSEIINSADDKNEDELLTNISGLIELWEEHFKYEENLMEQYGYTDIAAHKKEHEEINESTSNMRKMYSKGFKYVVYSLKLHLTLWIDEHVSHIEGEDKKLAEFLKKQGVT